MSDRLRRVERHAFEQRQRLALHVLDETPAVTVVREDGERQVPFGDELEQQDVSERAAVRGGHDAADPAQVPPETHVLVGRILAKPWRPHLFEGRSCQHGLAIAAGAVAQMERRVGEHVVQAHPDATRRHRGRPWERSYDGRFAILRAMRDREAVRGHVLESRERARQANRLEDQRADGLVDRPARDRLDHPARDREPRVVIAPDGARRRELRQVARRLHEERERLAAAVLRRELPFPSRRVREQMPDRHVAARVFVLYLEPRQIALHRRRQIDLPLLDEPHDGRRRHGLRDRSDREYRVSRDRLGVIDVCDAEAARGRVPVSDDPERNAGHAELRHLCGYQCDEALELRIGLNRDRGARRPCPHQRGRNDASDCETPAHGLSSTSMQARRVRAIIRGGPAADWRSPRSLSHRESDRSR